MKKIELYPDPHPLTQVIFQLKTSICTLCGLILCQKPESMEESSMVLSCADERKQESLQSEVIPDPMDGEQTWPTEEELAAAEIGMPCGGIWSLFQQKHSNRKL